MNTHGERIPILYVHESFQLGGAENSLLHLVSNLNRSRFDPYFVCSTEGRFADQLREIGIHVDIVPMPTLKSMVGWSKTVKQIRFIIRKWNAQIIHSNTVRSNIYAGWAGRREKIHVVWHARNLRTVEKIDTDKVFSFLADRIICNSDAIRDRFRNRHGNYIEKSITIINGVNVDLFSPSIDGGRMRKEFGISPDARVVGMTSRIAPGKGQEYFVQAGAQIATAYPDLRFLVVGEASMPEEKWREQHLIDMVKELGIQDRVIFTGFRSDIPQVLAAMDVLVLAADAEPCGRVLFEAMAMGKPIVGTNTGGTPEIVSHGETGILIPSKDPEAMATALRNLLKAPDKAQRMGTAGLKRVREHFTIQAHARKTEQVYEALVKS